ncbi:MAG: DUF1338 domain-containing protein [Kofleriaceae bacterium]
MPAHELLDALWRDYLDLTPQAARIHALFAARGEVIVNDHVALRTFARPGLGLDALAARFERAGWVPQDRYHFADKHLDARYWRHPDPAVPKLFISELRVDELPASVAATIDALVATLPAGFADRADLAWAGRPWALDHATYQRLLATSEYAAWVAAFGFRVNHFTVDVGRLRGFASLAEVNQFLVAEGFELNTAGGPIKGTPADFLEQSSTRADAVDVAFTDGVHRIPSCYYEFARRYPQPDGTVFQGFVPTSADKLFHSTDARR